MYKILAYFILITGLSIAGCKTGTQQPTGKLISVSILPEKYFVSKIAGSDYKVNVVIPPGASPESYEPSPRLIQEIYNSDIYFLIGKFAFEKALINSIRINDPSIPFIDISDGIEFLRAEEDHGDHRHEGVDPHVWMSPANALIISKNILNGLIRIFPGDSATFVLNHKKLVSEINSIDSLYRKNIPKLEGLNFLIYHPALGYLARDYGMKQHVLEFEGKEPPPSHIASIVNEARTNHIDFIFVQSQFSIDNARSIAREIGAKIVTIDPLNEDWPSEMKRILSNLNE